MSITTLVAMKEAAQSFQPLLLATITFPNGDVLRLATLPLNVAEGGVQYNSVDWLGRIESQDIKAVQAMDSSGFDRVPQVAVHIADADAYVWQNYEMNSARCFKGATLQLDLVGYDVDAGAFTSDIDTKFVGLCQPPERDSKTITLTAQAKINTQQTFLPPVRIQPRCPWVFPGDAASQADSVYDDSSFFECGYNPSGGRGTAGFTSCDYQRSSCVARGMSIQGGRGSFGGITFTPPLYWRSKSYVQSKTIQGTNSINDAKWGDAYPILYGTTRVSAKVQNVIGDGNSTRLEAVLCAQQLVGTRGTDPGSVQKVIFNDTEVPFVAYSQDKKLFRWDWVNNGSRDGKQSTDAGYTDTSGNPLGDWYGSLACIEVVVPIEDAQSSSVPTLKVLVNSPPLPQYVPLASVTISSGVGVATFASGYVNANLASNDPGFTIRITGNTNSSINTHYVGLTNWTAGPPGTVTFTATGVPNGTGTGGYLRYKMATDNPVWALLDAYEWANVRQEEISLASFVSAASVCDQQINYVNQAGSTVNTDADGAAHKRYRISAAFDKLTAAADVIAGIRNGFGAYVDWQGGLLNLRLKGPLAEQQPAVITGSNTSTPVSSHLRDGSSASGYPAYAFGPGSIKRVNGETTLKVSRQQNSPNQITFSFQDRDNGYQQDTINGTDSADAALMKAVLTQNLAVIGPNTFDQGMRISSQLLAESHYGNPSGKPTGTLIYDWLTTFRAEHLRPGQIVLLTDAQLGLSNQQVRIVKIAGGTNYEEMAITAQHHSDAWYLDTFGQTTSGSTTGNTGRDPVDRAPYPWGPGQIPPQSGDPLFAATDDTFDVEPNYLAIAKDGTVLPQITLYGGMPVNSFGVAQPPSLVPQATVTGTSGPFTGPASYFIGVAAKDANGKYSALSQFARADVVSGSVTSITIKVPSWGTGTSGYAVYAGTDPRRLSLQATASGTPATITLSTLNVSYLGAPDAQVNTMRVRNKKITTPGVFTGQVSATTSTTIKVAGAAWTVNLWAGRVWTNYSVPFVANFPITSNTSDTLTVTVDPTASPSISRPYSALGTYTQRMSVGDIGVIRAKVTVSGNTLTDANWLLDTTGAGVVGSYARIIAGTGRGKTAKITANTTTSVTTEPFTITPDTTSVVIIEAPNWLYSADHDPFQNSDPTAGIGLIVPVDNLDGHAVGVQAFAVASDGTESLADISPFRDMWIGGSSGTTGGVGAPGPIGTPTIVSIDDTSDPAFILIEVSYAPPSIVNGFNATHWYVTYTGYVTPIDAGYTNYTAGIPTSQTDILRVAKPTATSWPSAILWGASSSAVYENPLVVAAGPSQTPHASLGTIAAFTGATAPPAGAVGSITGIVRTSGAATGDTRWGMEVSVVSPSGGWATNNVSAMLVQLRGPSGAQSKSITLYKTDAIPSGSTTFTSKADISYWRPAFGTNEDWIIDVTPYNADDIPSATQSSSTITVTGGGSATPAPNPTSITNTVNYLDDGTWTVDVVWNFSPTTYQFVNYFLPTLYAYVPPPGGTVIDNSPVGNIGRFDFFDFGIPARFNSTTGDFTYTIGPFPRDNPVAQDFAVAAYCFSGIGVMTASPVVSAAFTITPVSDDHTDTTMNVSSLAATRNSPVNYGSDGIALMQFTATFNAPSNTTDAYALRVTVRNTLDSADVERLTGNDYIIGDNGGPGAAGSIGFGPWTEYVGNYRFTFYTINALGDKIGGTAPHVDVSLPTASTGKIDFTRFSPTTVNSGKFTVSGGKFTITAGGIVSTDISSINAATITVGTLSSTQIGSVNAATITVGQLVSTQIASVNAASITVGQIVSTQISSINASTITVGTLTSTQIGSVNAASISVGVLVSSQLQSGIIDSLKLINASMAVIQRVSSLPGLPNTLYPVGNSVLRTSDNTLWTNVSGTWTAASASSTLTGSIQSTDIISINAATINSGFIAAARINSINASSINIGTLTASQIGSLNGGVINVGTVGPTQISSVNASQLNAGTINVSVVLNAATINSPIITVSGAAFTINIDTTNGFKITNSTNSSSVSLQPGYVNVTGTGSFTGQSTIVQSGTLQTNGTGGASALISCGVANIPQVTCQNGSGGAIAMSCSNFAGTYVQTNVVGAHITLTGGNSYIQLNGHYRFQSGVQWDTTGGSISSYTKRLFAYDENGSFIGFIPIM